MADDWLEDCLDTVNAPGSIHVMLTSTQHKLAISRKGYAAFYGFYKNNVSCHTQSTFSVIMKHKHSAAESSKLLSAKVDSAFCRNLCRMSVASVCCAI